MKKILTVILAIATIALAAVFNWHGETVEAEDVETSVKCENSLGGNTSASCDQIVFSKDRLGGTGSDIFVMNADGSNPQALLPPDINGIIPRISKDGRLILFNGAAPSPFGIYLMKSDGTGIVQLTDGGYDAQLNSDNSKIVFVRGPIENRIDGNIYTMNADGTGLTQLTFWTGVTEGTVFSPDGTKILFKHSDPGPVRHFELFSINTDGTNLTQLTSTAQYQIINDAAFTPNGNKIVFESGCHCDLNPTIEIMNANGSSRTRLISPSGSGISPMLNRSGTKIVFVGKPSEDEGFGIHTMNLNGSGILRLTNSNELETKPFFTADDESILFHRSDSGGSDGFDLMKVDVDGSNLIRFRQILGGENSYTSGFLDPDADGIFGNCDSCPLTSNAYPIVFTNEINIWSMNADGSNVVRLTPFVGTNTSDNDPTISSDGRRIVFTSNRRFPRPGDRNEIYVMNVNGTNPTRLTDRSGVNASDDDRNPVFNPSGTKIAFVGTRQISGRSVENIFLMNADGTDQTQVTFFTNNLFNAIGNLSFSPDGTRILFDDQRGDAGFNTWDIYSINTNGTGEIRLTTATGQDSNPSYSPDGSKIVFISLRNGSEEVYLMNADGTNETRLTATIEQEYEPAFTPDGRKIAFVRNRVDSKIFLMDLDGTSVRRVSAQTGSFYERQPSFASQPDADGDGTGDACDTSFDTNTPAGANIAVQAPNANVSFPNVFQAGITSFTPITSTQSEMPQGYTLCPTCPAYDITTTANYTPPITVCLGVPANISQSLFLQMRLLHGENGVLVDRTSNRYADGNGQRFVCGNVNSLSPFILASNAAPTSASATVSGRAITSLGRSIPFVTVTLTAKDGTAQATRSNSFGYFRFTNVATGHSYVVNARSKSFTFDPASVLISVTDDVSDVNFVADP